MHFIPRDILTVSLILFAVIDIVGSLPAILSIKLRVGSINAEKASIWAFIIMLVFLFLGETILAFLGIDLKSFAIAGSIVLFLLAIEMLLGIKLYHDEMPATASIVPIAFPLIAGAGTMTTLLSLRSEYSIENIIAGIVINIVLVYLCLRNLKFIEKLLGEGGLSILRKVFSFILLAIAIKLFRTNVGF
ncbi:MAG: MarC family protein [Sphingobacteriales bacterium JAD_PAG50586_3]|nr:MAG: MarC family protein [Sphingobacteriales bacterium JAD_PAG50586_3]